MTGLKACNGTGTSGGEWGVGSNLSRLPFSLLYNESNLHLPARTLVQ